LLFFLSPLAPLALRQLPTSNDCNIKTCFSKQDCTWLGETTGKERVRGKVFDSLPFSDSQHTISTHYLLGTANEQLSVIKQTEIQLTQTGFLCREQNALKLSNLKIMNAKGHSREILAG